MNKNLYSVYNISTGEQLSLFSSTYAPVDEGTTDFPLNEQLFKNKQNFKNFTNLSHKKYVSLDRD